MLENQMADECYEYVARQSSFTNVVREVPFLSRCIDMVMITHDRKTITVEFKIKDWRHALEQVRSHRLGADRAYICLPEREPSKSLIEALTKEHVGLFLYSQEAFDKMQEYLPAPINPNKVDAFASILFEKASAL